MALRKRGVTFLTCFRKRGVPSEKGQFQSWRKLCVTRSLYTENEKSKLISRLSNFTNPFIPLCDDQVSDVAS